MNFASVTAQTEESSNQEYLRSMTRRLGMLSPEGVREAYRRAHESCRLNDQEIPEASTLQELITAWKLMKAWHERSSGGPAR